MSLRTDLDVVLERFRTSLMQFESDIRKLEEIADYHLNGGPIKKVGIAPSDTVKALQAVEKATAKF